jgi:hypothetical protein
MLYFGWTTGHNKNSIVAPAAIPEGGLGTVQSCAIAVALSDEPIHGNSFVIT